MLPYALPVARFAAARTGCSHRLPFARPLAAIMLPVGDLSCHPHRALGQLRSDRSGPVRQRFLKVLGRLMPVMRTALSGFLELVRLSKRKFELVSCRVSPKPLFVRGEFEWVPNGPSEHPQRKPGVRERFRASGTRARCTAFRKKWPNSLAFQGRTLGRESVAQGRLGGGRATVNKPSLPRFQ
jgi:hypothetical protein